MSSGGPKPNLGRVCEICGELRTWRSAARRNAARKFPGRPWCHEACCPEQARLEEEYAEQRAQGVGAQSGVAAAASRTSSSSPSSPNQPPTLALALAPAPTLAPSFGALHFDFASRNGSLSSLRTKRRRISYQCRKNPVIRICELGLYSRVNSVTSRYFGTVRCYIVGAQSMVRCNTTMTVIL